MNRNARLFSALAIAVSTISLMGCFKATGGGQLTGLSHGGKITTGFQLRCRTVGDSARITGQVQYQDRGANVSFHADMNSTLFGDITATCEQLDGAADDAGFHGTFSAVGTYTPQPKTRGQGGQVIFFVQDQTSNLSFVCPAGQDGLFVEIDGGIYDGYVEGGCLSKGNFTVFGE